MVRDASLHCSKATIVKHLIIIPTFNESQNIEKLLKEIELKIRDIDVLVVDDSSVDGTINIVESLLKEYSNIHLLIRPRKTGLGDAYRAGYTWALEHGFDSVIQMDADGSHRVDDLLQMLRFASTYDVVIGSRWIRGGRIQNWPMARFLLSRIGNLYGRLMLRIPIRDATAGFRIYSAAALFKAQMVGSKSQGYVFQLENSVRVTEANLSIIEVPITFVEREFGESKMSANIVKEAMLKVTLWGLQGRILKRTLFVK